MYEGRERGPRYVGVVGGEQRGVGPECEARGNGEGKVLEAGPGGAHLSDDVVRYREHPVPSGDLERLERVHVGQGSEDAEEGSVDGVGVVQGNLRVQPLCVKTQIEPPERGRDLHPADRAYERVEVGEGMHTHLGDLEVLQRYGADGGENLFGDGCSPHESQFA